MEESEATIPENSENSETTEPQEAPSEPAPSEPAPSEPPAEPKRGRGRPAGSKDKAPRVKVRVGQRRHHLLWSAPKPRAPFPSHALPPDFGAPGT